MKKNPEQKAKDVRIKILCDNFNRNYGKALLRKLKMRMKVVVMMNIRYE